MNRYLLTVQWRDPVYDKTRVVNVVTAATPEAWLAQAWRDQKPGDEEPTLLFAREILSTHVDELEPLIKYA